MNSFRRRLIIFLSLVAISGARGSSVLPLPLDEQLRAADAVFRGTVLRLESFRSPADGLIHTRTSLRVDEGFKGRLPRVISLVHRGGAAGDVELVEGLSPQFRVGEERLLFVTRRADGTLHAMQGDATATSLRRDRQRALARDDGSLLERIREKTRAGVGGGPDVTDQAASIAASDFSVDPSGEIGGPSTNGLLVSTSNVPARYVLPDRGEPISYLVDATSLPAGISEAQALSAVSNAMSAWAAASSFRFSFAGTQSFGMSAVYFTNQDGRIRVQLHDHHHYITATNVLGVGGSLRSASLLTNANWGRGGRVAGMEFNVGLNGYIILKHTNAAMQNLSTFTEVLTHEIGHVLGLAHSSNVATNDPALTNSIMFFLAHADGRGATLNAYDTNVIRLVHPTNTPPWTFHRVIDATTAPAPVNVPGINEVELRGYDLQGANLTLATNNQSSLNGDFVLASNKVRYLPSGYYADTDRDDPDLNGGSYAYKDVIYARYTDGTNASPYAVIRVVSLRGEGTYTPDGIPDYWMLNFFGHADPRANDLSRATDDWDGDGLNNLQEYLAGMNPKDPQSAQRILSVSPGSLQFQARAYEPYEVLGSTNLVTWPCVAARLPTNASLQVRTTLPQTNILATISNLPAPALRSFFRVLKVP